MSENCGTENHVHHSSFIRLDAAIVIENLLLIFTRLNMKRLNLLFLFEKEHNCSHSTTALLSAANIVIKALH